MRRRHLAVQHHCAVLGLWSRVVADRVITWHKHVLNSEQHSDRTNRPWYAFLIRYRGEEWLAGVRRRYSDRTNSRAWVGAPTTRVEDSFRSAQALLSS